MRRLYLFVFVFTLFYFTNAGDLKKVMKAYEKGDLVKTEEIIQKSLAVQPINPGVRYYYSLLFFNINYAKANIDSARIQIRQALSDYDNSSEEIKKEMNDESVSLDQLNRLLQAITQRWFDQSREEMNIEKWQEFISLFPDAVELPRAVFTRDSLAYYESKTINDIPAWKTFIERFPKSTFAGKANTTLDSLMVASHILSNNKAELMRFIGANGKSEKIESALAHLLKLETLSGEPTTYLSFITKYKPYAAAQKAIDWMFHIDKEDGFQHFNKYVQFHKKSDSLTIIRKQDAAFYFPVFDKGYTMYSSDRGAKSLSLDSIVPEINCDGWVTDVVASTSNSSPVILSKSGKQICKGTLVRDLGYGLLLIDQGDQMSIIHKTGMMVLSNVTDAEILKSKFLKVKRDKWALVSLMGLALTEFRFDEIFTEGNFWFFQKDGLLATATFSQIVSSFPAGLYLEFKFEDYEMINSDELVGFRDDRECLLKSDGTFRVPWGRHHIYPNDSLGYIKDDRGYALYGALQYSYFPFIQANSGFVIRKSAVATWSLSSNFSKWTKTSQDSIQLLNTYFAIIPKTEAILIFHNQMEVVLKASQIPFTFSPSAKYLLIKDKISSVINEFGGQIFSGNFDEIKLLGDSLFSISFRGKNGLINANGKELLPMKYEYLDSKAGMVSTLSKGKIGGYDLERKITFDPVYDTKIERLDAYFKTSKLRKTGLIDAKQNEILPFAYDDILPWTIGKVWVQNADEFALINLESKEAEMNVTLLSKIEKSNDLFKYYGSNGFGVVSKKSGVLLPPEFTDIRVMGSPKNGVLVAEQALPQAGFFVLTYFTFQGERIYSHAYRKAEYDKVFCDD